MTDENMVKVNLQHAQLRQILKDVRRQMLEAVVLERAVI